MEGVTRYPLSWPIGWKRTAQRQRKRPVFSAGGLDITTWKAIERLRGELSRLGAKDVVLSTSLRTRLDGWPYSDQRAPDDPGAAVYFVLKGADRCLACDAWSSVAGNIAAIAAHIDALRRIDRYGVGTLDQAFAGYTALPARVEDSIAWWEVLRLDRLKATPESISEAYRALAFTHHPDRGGNTELMTKITLARDAALRELRGEK